MDDQLKQQIKSGCGIELLSTQQRIQRLWSGYGEIVRYKATGGLHETVIVKHVQFPDQTTHPRGWNTDHSHLRKVRSYEVESHWYMSFAAKADSSCRLPHCYHVEPVDNGVLLVMEDLDAAGFSKRKSSVDIHEMEQCLHWLANFHATFMQQQPDGLWPVGTYWHLATRPDELQVLDDVRLREAAPLVDSRLNNAVYKTFVHGDAKLANFCFGDDGTAVAAVDFQYVGGGCGMKDVAYFIGSCLYEEDIKTYEERLLNSYFLALHQALQNRNSNIDYPALEAEWRALFPYAWTDFHRFLKGWSPGHWKLNSYSERMARKVIEEVARQF